MKENSDKKTLEELIPLIHNTLEIIQEKIHYIKYLTTSRQRDDNEIFLYSKKIQDAKNLQEVESLLKDIHHMHKINRGFNTSAMQNILQDLEREILSFLKNSKINSIKSNFANSNNRDEF